MLNLNELKNEKIENIKENVLPDLLDEILLICKEDDNFKVSKNIRNYDEFIKSEQKKLDEKKKLLNQSKEIEEKLLNELENLKQENYIKRSNLLSELGSEVDD